MPEMTSGSPSWDASPSPASERSSTGAGAGGTDDAGVAVQPRHCTLLLARSYSAEIPADSVCPHVRHLPAYRRRITFVVDAPSSASLVTQGASVADASG